MFLLRTNIEKLAVKLRTTFGTCLVNNQSNYLVHSNDMAATSVVKLEGEFTGIVNT